VVVATESLYFLEPATGEVQGRFQWPGKAVDFVTGMPSQVAVLRQQTRDERERNLAGGQPPLEPEALLVYERTRLIHEIQCSRYSHAVRFCPATGLLYASGLHALDIINPVTREWLHTLRVDKNAVYGLPDVAQQMIYALTEKGAVYAMRHP
jgi:hypothetical protein